MTATLIMLTLIPADPAKKQIEVSNLILEPFPRKVRTGGQIQMCVGFGIEGV